MKIALIGASGLVGSAVLNEALLRGHELTAIVRNPDSIKQKDKNLTVVKADATKTDELAEVLKNQDAVISAYNAGGTGSDAHNNFLSGLKNIGEAVKKSGVKRFLAVLGAGSLYIKPGVQLVDTDEFPKEWKPLASAARDYLDVLKTEAELEWTALSPAIEFHAGVPHEKKGVYRTGTDEPVFDTNGKSTISPEDLAVAVLDEIEQPKFIRKRFTVAY